MAGPAGGAYDSLTAPHRAGQDRIKQMTIAVTAASGRLGQATLAALKADAGSDALIGIARDPGRIALPGIAARAGDYGSITQMTSALEGVESVVMISAPVVAGTDRVAMHRNVIEAARRAGVRKIVFTSVIGGPGEEKTGFFATQQVNRQTEADLAAAGLAWVVARNGLYLDLDIGHIIRADAGGVYSNNAGDGRCGYISIAELGVAIARLAARGHCNGRIVNLVSENLTQGELVELVNDVFGLAVRYESITIEQNIARFMADEHIAARGEGVARMLTGCFECIAGGAFDVPSHFAEAAGRPAKSIRDQLVAIRDRG